ncbi:MAG: NYN domain-containing protein [Puniceicoccaceae bacterium]
MRIRKLAILIDGGFFLKRQSKVVAPKHCDSADAVAKSATILCRNCVRRLIGERGVARNSRVMDYGYRLFYYDAAPFDEVTHHPILNQQIQFGKTPEAQLRTELFSKLRRQRKFALRLGKVTKEDRWRIKDAAVTKKLLRTQEWVHLFDHAISPASPAPASQLSPSELAQVKKIADAWRNLQTDDVRLAVPAAKVARREGVEFLLDPLWQQVSDDLPEHVDGVVSGFPRPGTNGDPSDEADSPADDSKPS